jgi:pimeloyl-ACP methyl ester carboxylesterase
VGWRTADVVGSSLGGQIALELARRGRARTVLAISPAGMWTRRESMWEKALLKLVRALSHAPSPDLALRLVPVRVAVAGTMLGRPWRADPARLAEDTRLLRDAPAYEATIRELHRRHPEGLEEVRCPVLVAWGTRDRLTLPRQAKRWVAAIPGAELRWLPRLGHLPMLEEPELIADMIHDFARRSAAPNRSEGPPSGG